MAEGHATLFTREWWITVFLVGLGIHLCASYLKPHLDQIGGWFSRSWATRNKTRAHERRVRIDRLRCDETARWVAAQVEIRQRLQALTALTFVIVLGLFLAGLEYLRHIQAPIPIRAEVLETVLLLFILVTTLAGMTLQGRATNIENELREALDKRDETKTPGAANDDPENILPRQF